MLVLYFCYILLCPFSPFEGGASVFFKTGHSQHFIFVFPELMYS